MAAKKKKELTAEQLFDKAEAMFIRKGTSKSALKIVEKALKLERSHYDALVLSGGMLVDLGERRRGFAQLKRAIALDRSDPHAYFCIGTSYLGINRYSDAITYLKRALQKELNGGKDKETLQMTVESIVEALLLQKKHAQAVKFLNDFNKKKRIPKLLKLAKKLDV